MKKTIYFFVLLMLVLTMTGAGYVGTLPDVEAEFAYMKKEKSEKAVSPFSIEQLDKLNEEKLKQIPKDNDSYIDIVIKRNKTSSYTNDINFVLIILEKLRICLNTNKDIQKFNAIVSNLIDNIEYIHIKYQDKEERNYASYNKLLLLSQQARETAAFRTQGLVIQKYMPAENPDNIYTKENLEKRLEELLNSVNDTIYVIKNIE